MIRIQYAEAVPYKVRQLARLGIQGGGLAACQLSFELLPAYLDPLHQNAQTIYTHLEINHRTARSVRMFICPKRSQDSGSTFVDLSQQTVHF
jgi:hypothetical protein